MGKVQALIGSTFFVISPIVIERMFRHTALGGHWMILAAVYLYVRHEKDYQKLKNDCVLGILGGLIAAVHLYFLPMCGAFVWIYFMQLYKGKGN